MTRQDPAPTLNVVGLTRTYGTGRTAVQALRGVSFHVEPGEIVCIMGKSGSGKSTLLRLLGLIDRPTGGRIEISGTDVGGLAESRRQRLRLERFGFVFQEYALLPELTAEENVYLPQLMLGATRSACQARARELLGILDLAERGAHRPSQLSGGEQQRVAIARALVNRPAVLFADEPTGNLDTLSTAAVMEALVEMNRSLGVTIVFVSHDPDHRAYARRSVYLRDGQLAEPYF